MNPSIGNFLIFIIFLILALFLWIFIMYIKIEKLFGTVAARRDLHRIAALTLSSLTYLGVAFAIFFFLMSLNVARLYLDIAGFILSSPVLLVLIDQVDTWRKRKRLAGIVLLDLGLYSECNICLILLGGLYIANAARLVVSVFSNLPRDSETAINSLIHAIMFGGFGGLSILLSLGHLEIRERGICYPFGVIQWEASELPSA